MVLNNEDVTDTLIQEDNETIMFVIDNLNIEVTCTNASDVVSIILLEMFRYNLVYKA